MVEKHTVNKINDTVPDPSSYEKIYMEQKTGGRRDNLPRTKRNDNLELRKAKFTPLEIKEFGSSCLIPVKIAYSIKIHRDHSEDAEWSRYKYPYSSLLNFSYKFW